MRTAWLRDTHDEPTAIASTAIQIRCFIGLSAEAANERESTQIAPSISLFMFIHVHSRP